MRLAKVDDNALHVTITVVRHSTRCFVCGASILEANWALKVSSNEIAPAIIHDNDMCLERLKMQLGLPANEFLAAFVVED